MTTQSGLPGPEAKAVLEAVPARAVFPECPLRYFVLAYCRAESWKIHHDLQLSPYCDGMRRLIERLQRDGWSHIHILKLPDFPGEKTAEAPDTSIRPVFANVDAAWQWLEDRIGNACLINRRLAFLHNDGGMQEYQKAITEGSGFSFDQEIILYGRRAMIGCNFELFTR